MSLTRIEFRTRVLRTPSVCAENPMQDVGVVVYVNHKAMLARSLVTIRRGEAVTHTLYCVGHGVNDFDVLHLASKRRLTSCDRKIQMQNGFAEDGEEQVINGEIDADVPLSAGWRSVYRACEVTV